MKKLCLLLALCLTVLCALPMGAGAEAADPTLSAMVQRALKLADIMQECAQSEAYCSLYAGSAEIGALCAAMGEGPYDAPVSGALLTLSPAAMDRLLQIGDSAPALPEGIRQKIFASLPATLCTMQVSRAGAVALAASAMLSCGDCAVMAADMPQAAVLSLSFGGAYDVLCAFYTNESGVTQANAYLVAAENNMLSSPELAELLDDAATLRALTAAELSAAQAGGLSQ